MKNLLRILLIASFLNALSWIILMPVWQYPDEQAHFAQLQNLAELGETPAGGNDTSYEIFLSEKILGTERDGFGNNKFTYHPEFHIEYSNSLNGYYEKFVSSQDKSSRILLVKKEATLNPPFYYHLGALSYKIFDNGDLFQRVYAARFISLILFILLIIVAYKVSTLVFEYKKVLAISLTSFVAFMPMLVYSSTGVSPDSLTNLLFSLILLISLKIISGKFKFKIIAILLITFIVLGVLTRQQFLISIPILLVAIIFYVHNNIKLAKSVVMTITTFAIFLIFVNTIGLSIPIISHFRVAEFHLSFGKVSLSSFGDYVIWSFKRTIFETWPWYWGVYKWLSLTLSPIYYQIINRLVVISVIGLLIKFFLTYKRKSIEKKDIYLVFLILAALIYFLLLTIWDYLFKLSYGFSFGIQGRYFFPLVIAHLAIILIGLQQVLKIMFKDYTKYTLFLLVVLMIVFNNASLFSVTVSYYDVSSVSTFIIQASQYKPEIFKGVVIPIIVFSAIVTQALFLLKFGKFTILFK